MPSISVVAAGDPDVPEQPFLQALLPQLSQADEIILVSAKGSKSQSSQPHPSVQHLEAAAGSLAPVLWKHGLDQAGGDVVAFTNARLLPSESWLHTIRSADWGVLTGLGGPIAGPAGGSRKDWALYFGRFNAYFPPGHRESTWDLAGDNAAYLRQALLEEAESLQDGFWETVFHARVREKGGILQREPAMLVTMAAGHPHTGWLRTRFRHGRHYAATLDLSLIERLARLAAAPAVPLRLYARIFRRVQRELPTRMATLLACTPHLMPFLTAWSLGEVAGHLQRKS